MGEWSGALGDLGTLLPLGLALVASNGFPLERVLLLWGIAYIVTGVFFRVPVSVQPLKAMAAITIAAGLSPQMLSSTAVFYGILLVALSVSGALGWLKRWFSAALVRGVQLGIGLILARRALQIVVDRGLFLHLEPASPVFGIVLMSVAAVLLGLASSNRRTLLAIPAVIIGSAAAALLLAPHPPMMPPAASLEVALPDLSFLVPALLLLIIPQLPLTLGNAVYAASETSHQLWGRRAERVSPKRLGLSIGLGNIVIGLLGGFPMCHGAGGMAAHARLGGRTGGTTIIIGTALVVCALVTPASRFVHFIPVPILGAILLLTSWRMIVLFVQLKVRTDVCVAVLVGVLSFISGNLALAVGAGIALEKTLAVLQKRAAARLERSAP